MTEHRIEIVDDPDTDVPLSGDVMWRCSCGEDWSGGNIVDAARNAAAHQVGDAELADLLGVDPDDAASDADVDDYIVGIPILAELARHADPAAWVWLTEVHETLDRLNEQPIWRTEITPRITCNRG